MLAPRQTSSCFLKCSYTDGDAIRARVGAHYLGASWNGSSRVLHTDSSANNARTSYTICTYAHAHIHVCERFDIGNDSAALLVLCSTAMCGMQCVRTSCAFRGFQGCAVRLSTACASLGLCISFSSNCATQLGTHTHTYTQRGMQHA